jgi:hypothetical protein
MEGEMGECRYTGIAISKKTRKYDSTENIQKLLS